jgi:hypothetical protein
LNEKVEDLEDDEMPNNRRHLDKSDGKRRTTRAIKQRLVLLIGFLTAILLVLLFGVGEAWWPGWMVAHQKQIIGIVLLAIICVLALSPIIIEADSNPRALSGPGKNPKGPRPE